MTRLIKTFISMFTLGATASLSCLSTVLTGNIMYYLSSCSIGIYPLYKGVVTMTHLSKAFILTWVLGAIASLFCLIIVLTGDPTYIFLGGAVGAYPLYKWFYHMIHTVDDRKESEIND